MDGGRNRVEQQQAAQYPQYPMDDAHVIPGGASISPAGGLASPTWPGAPNAAYEAERYERARKRVKELRSFYASLTSYLSVNFVLFLINLFSSPGHWWFYWPLFFLGHRYAFSGVARVHATLRRGLGRTPDSTGIAQKPVGGNHLTPASSLKGRGGYYCNVKAYEEHRHLPVVPSPSLQGGGRG